MAFVSKQERDTQNAKSETRNIGPGEYCDKGIDDDQDKEKQNFCPFNSQVDRVTFEIPYEHKIRNIGPGAYEASSSFIKKSFSTKSYDYFNTVDKNLFDLIEKTKAIQGKDNKRRIKESLLINKLQSRKSLLSQRESKPRPNFKVSETRNNSHRAVSIPFKNSFGYVLDDQNNPVIVENPNQGVKYYAELVSDGKSRLKKKLRGIEWSKMSIKNSTTDITSGNNSNIAPFTQQSISLNNSAIDKPSKALASLKKVSKLRKVIKKQVPIEDQIIDEVLAKPPGPGYYWNEEYNPFLKKLHNKPRPFGSSEQRELKLDERPKENNTKVGPGSYYKTRYMTKEVNYYPFNANDRKMLDAAYKENPYLGPGSYNIRKEVEILKPASLYYGELNRRFNYHIKEENINPGPGEYIDIRDWGKKEPSPILSDKIKKSMERKEFSPPGVGSYHQDIVNSIEYKNKASENKLQSFIAPFSSGTERFIVPSNSMSNILGPGCYFSGKKDKKEHKQKGYCENNDRGRQMKDEGLGPGAYNYYNYYHWNKRSFNVNFV